MSTCKNRSVVADSSGNLWDLANPNLIGIESASGGTSTGLTYQGGNQQIVTIAFTTASAAFNAS